MESNEVIPIFWKKDYVGDLINPMPDMWYLEGLWEPTKSQRGQEFKQLISSFDTKVVLADWREGALVELYKKNSAKYALAISLSEEWLYLRIVTNQQNIDLLKRERKY